jgi:hypothetical protein
VRTGVVEVFALEINLGAAEMRRQPLGKIKRRRTADIMRQIAVHFALERWVFLRLVIGALQIENERHQRFGDETAAINSKMSALVRAGAK